MLVNAAESLGIFVSPSAAFLRGQRICLLPTRFRLFGVWVPAHAKFYGCIALAPSHCKPILVHGLSTPDQSSKNYPHQFSGGMRQRVMIALSLACKPDILIADEPTTALDVTIQAQILDLIEELKRKLDMSVIFITHDLGVVAHVADRVAVMYAGRIVEIGTAEEVFYYPQNPYTWGLICSMPSIDTTDAILYSIPGAPPNLLEMPKGDAFAPRNSYALAIDFEEKPPLFKVSESHFAATWLLHPSAPKVTAPKEILRRYAIFQSFYKKTEEVDVYDGSAACSAR